MADGGSNDGIKQMLRTIVVGSCVLVQGVMVGSMADGKMMVNVDGKTFIGVPVPTYRAA
jgi:hypothetical protein